MKSSYYSLDNFEEKLLLVIAVQGKPYCLQQGFFAWSYGPRLSCSNCGLTRIMELCNGIMQVRRKSVVFCKATLARLAHPPISDMPTNSIPSTTRGSTTLADFQQPTVVVCECACMMLCVCMKQREADR